MLTTLRAAERARLVAKRMAVAAVDATLSPIIADPSIIKSEPDYVDEQLQLMQEMIEVIVGDWTTLQ